MQTSVRAMLRCWSGASTRSSALQCCGDTSFIGTLLRTFATDIVVPSMGDSISEGTVANVLKKTNDAVDEDEPVLQIETDKVTLDVRAPTAGTLRAITVKEEDVVTVGQVVAVLDEGEGGGGGGSSSSGASSSSSGPSDSGSSSKPDKSQSSSPPTPSAPSYGTRDQADYEQLSDAASEKSAGSMRGHKARITFPPRRTKDGKVISAMPAADQDKYRARISGSKRAESDWSRSGGDAERRSGEVALATDHPDRRTLSDDEMEAIMLGGADVC